MASLKAPFKSRSIPGIASSVTLAFIIILSLEHGHAEGNLPWQRTQGPDAATNIAVIAFHPASDSVLFVGTNRGMYKTTDAGDNWIEVSGGLPTHLAVNDIAIDHDNPEYMYARTDYTLYRSTDGGNTWLQTDLNPQGEGGYRLNELAIDPNHPEVIYQVVKFEHLGKNEIWKSDDQALTWSCLYSVGPGQDIDYFFEKLLISHFNSNTMWVSAHSKGDTVSHVSGVLISHDGGHNWSSYGAYDPLEGKNVTRMVLDPVDSLTFYLAGRNYPDLIYRTRDGGQTWETLLSERNADICVGGIYIDPNNTNLLYAVWGAFFLVSRDGGATWDYWDGRNTSGVATDFGTMVVSPNDSNLIYLGGVGGVVKSVDGGANFVLIRRGLRSLKLRCVKVNPYDPNEAYALSFRGYGIYKTTNGGDSWFQSRWSRVSFCSMLIDVAQSNSKTIYVTGGGAFRSTDSGTSWEHFNNQFGASHAHGVAVDPFDENIIYIGVGADKSNPIGQGMYRSMDGGATWENIDNGFPTPVHVADIKIDPANPRIVYIATRGEMAGFDLPKGPGKGIFKSINRGDEWFSINNGLTNPSVHAIAIDPQDPNILYAATEAHGGYGLSGGVFKSTNGGESWFSINNGFPQNYIDDDILNLHTIVIDPSNPQILYVGRLENPDDVWNTSGNIYKTTDAGATWFEFDDGLCAPNSNYVPGIEYLDIEPTGSVLYCGTYDGGVYKLGSLADVDTIAPVIIAGPALFDFAPTSATIRWNTHEPATSIIQYGVPLDYGRSVESASLILHHKLVLTDLDPDTTYHFRIGSKDSLGNGPRWSKDFTFKLSQSDIEKPRFIDVTNLENVSLLSPIRIDAHVSDNYGVSEVCLFYSTDNGASYNEVPMNKLSRFSYFAEITPAQTAGYVDYYLRAKDVSGNVSYYPDTAPMNTFAFSMTENNVTPFLYVPVIDQGTAEINLKTGDINYPITFSSIAKWIPYANDSLMVGLRREGIVIAETRSNQVIAEMNYPNSSEDWPWSPCALISNDGKYLYMEKQEFTDTIAVINLETLSLKKVLTLSDLDRRINGLALSSNGRMLYVTNGSVWKGTTTEGSRYHYNERRLELAGSHKQKSLPRAAESNVTDKGYLHVIDTETGGIIKVIPLGIEARGIDFSNDYSYLYAVALIAHPHGTLRVIYKIDPYTNAVVDSSEFGAGGCAPLLFVTRKSSACYIIDPQIVLMNLENLEVIKSLPFDFEREIYEVLMTEDDNYLLFSDRYYGEVLVLDTRSNTFTDTLRFNSFPNGLAIVYKHYSTTSIDDRKKETLPHTLALLQNYPNPWNPHTTIPFTVPSSHGKKVRVRLSVYDLQGRLVRVLLDEFKEPGSYSITWDGKNERGLTLASGIYFMEIRAGGERRARKMVLVR